MHDPPPSTRRVRGERLALAACVAAGLALRLANAFTAAVHGDELHYTRDAAWATAPLGGVAALQFLRDHPGPDHPRLEPGTGTVDRWPEPDAGGLVGHPSLYQYVLGAVLAFVPPARAHEGVPAGRVLNALADSATVALLPALVRLLGAGPEAGLAAAALYAIFPPAVAYGSIANIDPFLAPLLVALLVVLLRPAPGLRGWARAGVLTGLLAGAKQTGLVAVALVPLLSPLRPAPRLRGLAVWAVTAAAVLGALTSPRHYVAGLRADAERSVALHRGPATNALGNLAAAVHTDGWYWLSFSRHGRPLAPLLARAHRVMTPAYLVLYAAGLASVLARRRWRRLVVLYLPVLPVLAAIAPSDGMWRFQLLWPLVCCAAATEALSWSRPVAAAAVTAAALAGLVAVLPQRPGPDGALDLGDLLFANPAARQQPGFHGSPAGPGLAVVLQPGMVLTRRLWLVPGRYEVTVAASAPARIALDDHAVPPAGGDVRVDGFVHRLTIAMPSGGELRGVALRWRPD